MTKYIKTLLFSLVVTSVCIAEDQLPISSDVAESPPLKKAQINRMASKFEGLLMYSPIDLLIPSKFGFTLGYIETVDTTWQFEFVRGSVSAPFFFTDIGKMTDQRVSLLRRNYLQTNSFYISYGVSYMDFSTKLGSEYINSVSNGSVPEVDILRMRNFGVQFSIGNQWCITKHFVAGVDWIGIYQPLIQLEKKSVFLDYTTNPEYRDNVDEVIKALSYIPRLTLMKLQIGATF